MIRDSYAASSSAKRSVYAIHYVDLETASCHGVVGERPTPTSLRTDDFEWEGGVLSVTGSNSVDMSTCTYDGGNLAFASPVARSANWSLWSTTCPRTASSELHRRR